MATESEQKAESNAQAAGVPLTLRDFMDIPGPSILTSLEDLRENWRIAEEFGRKFLGRYAERLPNEREDLEC